MARTSSRSASTFFILSRMRRRSVSSWLSPGPRVPIPPPVRDSRPQPGQPRQVVLERGELDLEAALLCPGVAGEDVDDQRRAVQHLAVEQPLEAALLVRVQLVVHDQHVEVGYDLLVDHSAARPLPKHHTGSGLVASLDAAHDRRAGRLGQRGELSQRALHRPAVIGWVIETDEEGALDRVVRSIMRARSDICSIHGSRLRAEPPDAVARMQVTMYRRAE